MLKQTEFVIYKSDSRYSITECSNSGLKRAFLSGGSVTGDGDVLQRLARMKPQDLSIETYIEENAGSLILEPQKF